MRRKTLLCFSLHILLCGVDPLLCQRPENIHVVTLPAPLLKITSGEEFDPLALAIANRFYEARGDDYDFLTIFTTFSLENPDSIPARYQPVRNDIDGIGRDLFDKSDHFFPDAQKFHRLQGIILMYELDQWPDDFNQRFERSAFSTFSVLAQELGHRWGAYIRFKRDDESREDLLGRNNAHWSFYFNTQTIAPSVTGRDVSSSSLQGNAWQENGNGTFSTIGDGVDGYSMLDLYLMGLVNLDTSERFSYISNPSRSSLFSSLPSKNDNPKVGVTVRGKLESLTLADVINQEKPRNPAVGPNTFRQAFILVEKEGEPATELQISKVDKIRKEWKKYFNQATFSLGQVVTSLVNKTGPLLSINKTSFCVGDTWTLGVTDGQPGSSVFLHVWKDINNDGDFNDPGEDTGESGPYGDPIHADGTWDLGGTFDSNAIGNWRIQATVAEQQSNPITFSILSECDTTDPTVDAFRVSPGSVTIGNPFTISYTASDAGGSGLNGVELNRANDRGGSPVNWTAIDRNSHSGNGPVSGSFSDVPSSEGTYWYGVHAVDNAGNRTPEPNPPGPIKVTVDEELTLSVSLLASPSSGSAPLNGVDLTATVSGSATGTINYIFYCDRSDSGTKITSGWADKFDGINDNPKTAVDACNYNSAGTYTAKVIAERGDAPPAEARTTITVSRPPQPTLRIDGDLSSTLQQNGGTFQFTGSNYTQDGKVTRYLRDENENKTILKPTLPSDDMADSNGNIGWQFAPGCEHAPGDYTIWVVDEDTKRKSNTVTETITASDSCLIPQITYIDPPQVEPSTFTLTINGKNFDSGAKDQVYWKATGTLIGSGVESGDLISLSSNQLVVKERMDGVEPGTYLVRVKNGNGKLSNGVDLVVLPTVTYEGHFAFTGWSSPVSNGDTLGEPGGNQLEAIKIWLSDYGITYRAHVAFDGWLGWVSDGGVAGTTGEAKQMEAIEIKLVGAPSSIHVWYRVYIEGFTWQGWASDGATAGTVGEAKAIQAIEIKIED
ncbi:hypothetical protein MYX78_00210 [Acidobacteria bacterium AH-259-G07]|nr:hypothetical protein [Acidobacteria bacterium AH-259-G07]